MEWVAKLGVFCAVTLGGCGPVVPYSSDGDETTAAHTASGPGTTSTTSTTSITSTTSTTGPVGTSASTSDDGPATTHGSFIDPVDAGSDYACDPWTGEPCEEGFKCMPYANDGGSSWNATKCTPLDPNPAAPGDPCTVEGNGLSGIDNCEAFSMCWDVDPETNMGWCVAFCSGSAANPTCPDPCTQCNITSRGVLIICLPICDPLVQNCPPGNACYPLQDVFVCAPDASGDTGTAGDPCEYLNVCDPGLFCANADAVEGCAGSLGCCAPFCTVGGFDVCAPLGPNTECIPYYEDPPPASQCQSADIGVCIVPG